MSRVLIVSKTRMRGDRVCVGGHDLDDNMRSLRLMRPDGSNMPADTAFEVGDIWEFQYSPSPHAVVPHVEDVLVRAEDARKVDARTDLAVFLRAEAVIWSTGAFEGKLVRTSSGAGYVPIKGPFPSCSTGYWLAPADLRPDGYGRYQFDSGGGTRRIRYVGVAPETPTIPSGTLLRLSLARPWAPPSAPPGLYLQLSGWYFEA